MHLVPISRDALEGTAPVWLPFLERIARRTRNHLDQLLVMVRTGEVHIHLVWDDETKTAKALAGTQITLRGDDRIAEFVWMTGLDRKHWQHLLPELETYHREHLGCVGMKAIPRPGWSKLLKAAGYRITHLVMEKEFHG